MGDPKIPDTFRYKYPGPPGWKETCGCEVWEIDSGPVEITNTGNDRRPVRVWTGPPTDRLRLDLMAGSPLVTVAASTVEIEVRAAYDCNPGVSLVTGHFVVPADGNNVPMMLVQLAGVLSTSWELLGRITNGPGVKLRFAGLVDRVGLPRDVFKGGLQ